MNNLMEKRITDSNKEYAFYDILNHAFSLKFLFQDYNIVQKDDIKYIKMSISYSFFAKYYQNVKENLSYCKIEKITKLNLIEKITNYCMFSLDLSYQDYDIIYQKMYYLYHPNNSNYYTKEELETFYGNKAQQALKLQRNLTAPLEFDKITH